MTSRWQCIFGRGCQGIYADRPDDGCCTLGAHFADATDERRVRQAARQLTAAQWQYRREARRRGLVEVEDADGFGKAPAHKTRVVDDACIFLNRPGFAGGRGCALHLLALESGRSPVETKPDVCWQLPIRRQFRTVTRSDDTTYTEVTIGEYGREGWGPGGHELDWYCSANTEAHTASVPVYRTARDELVALLGPRGYAVLVELCEDFASRAGSTMRHPADPTPAEPSAPRSRAADAGPE